MGRVVFTRKAEPAVDWSEIESRLQDISTSSRSHPLIGPPAALTNDSRESASDGSVVSLSSHQDVIPEFQAATAASALSQGGRRAPRHEIAFIDPSIFDLEGCGASMSVIAFNFIR